MVKRVRLQNILGLEEVVQAIAPLAGLTENVTGSARPKIQARPLAARPSACRPRPPTLAAICDGQIWTADYDEVVDQLQHAIDTLRPLGVGDGVLCEADRTKMRDLLAMMMFVPNPRSGSGQPTVPISVPVQDPRGAGLNVTIEYWNLWFSLPAGRWPAALAAYKNPQSLVAFGQGGAAGAMGAEGGVGETDGEETDLEVQLRERAEARSAAAMERARRRAARRAEEVTLETKHIYVYVYIYIYTLYLIPYTSYLIPYTCIYTLYLIPYTLYLKPYTLYLIP